MRKSQAAAATGTTSSRTTHSRRPTHKATLFRARARTPALSNARLRSACAAASRRSEAISSVTARQPHSRKRARAVARSSVQRAGRRRGVGAAQRQRSRRIGGRAAAGLAGTFQRGTATRTRLRRHAGFRVLGAGRPALPVAAWTRSDSVRPAAAHLLQTMSACRLGPAATESNPFSTPMRPRPIDIRHSACGMPHAARAA